MLATAGSDATHSSAIYSGESISDNARNELGEALAIRPITNLSIIVVGLNEEGAADVEGAKVGNGVGSGTLGDTVVACWGARVSSLWVLSGVGAGVGGFVGAIGGFVGALGGRVGGTYTGLGVSSLGVLVSVPRDGAKVEIESGDGDGRGTRGGGVGKTTDAGL